MIKDKFDKIFSKKLHKKLRPFLKIPMSKKKQEILKQRLISDLSGEDYEGDRKPLIKTSVYSDYLHELLNEYVEIEESLERMRYSSIFISHPPIL